MEFFFIFSWKTFSDPSLKMIFGGIMEKLVHFSSFPLRKVVAHQNMKFYITQKSMITFYAFSVKKQSQKRALRCRLVVTFNFPHEIITRQSHVTNALLGLLTAVFKCNMEPNAILMTRQLDDWIKKLPKNDYGLPFSFNWKI